MGVEFVNCEAVHQVGRGVGAFPGSMTREEVCEEDMGIRDWCMGVFWGQTLSIMRDAERSKIKLSSC